MKKIVSALFIVFLVLLVVPVLVKSVLSEERRQFEWVELDETTFSEVRFRNQFQGLDLAGLLFVPEGDGPFPGIVIIHGSGTSRRDNGWYLTLVKDLQDHGVVVLLPDKRGSEKSEGNWLRASLEDLATDTIAAVEYLKWQDEVDVSDVGVIGLSQGGQIAPIVASEMPELDFVVSIVSGAVPMHEMLVYEENHNLREMGVLPGLSNLLAYPAAWSIIELRQKGFWSAIGNFHSITYWEKVTTDSLVLLGEKDTNVPTEKSAEAIRSLGRPNIEVRIYEGSGHALESPPGEGNSIFREDVLRDIRRFIDDVTGDGAK